MEKLKKDGEFSKRITEAADDKRRNRKIQSEGFDFTQAEFDTIVSELSEKELKGNFGGVVGALGSQPMLVGQIGGPGTDLPEKPHSVEGPLKGDKTL